MFFIGAAEAELAGQDVAPLVQPSFAPVAVPEAGQAPAALFLSVETGLVDLPDLLLR